MLLRVLLFRQLEAARRRVREAPSACQADPARARNRADGSLPDPAQDLPQHLLADPTPTATPVMVMAVVAVPATLDSPKQPLRLIE